MQNKNNLDQEYSTLVDNNPNTKFILYLRWHPEDKNEELLIKDLVSIYGECKKLLDKRLIIFIVIGNQVKEFINIVNSKNTMMYLSFIQTEEELFHSSTDLK